MPCHTSGHPVSSSWRVLSRSLPGWHDTLSSTKAYQVKPHPPQGHSQSVLDIPAGRVHLRDSLESPWGQGLGLRSGEEIYALATSLGPPIPTPSAPLCTHRASLCRHGRMTSLTPPWSRVPVDPWPQADNQMPTPWPAPGIYSSNICDPAAGVVQCHVQNPALRNCSSVNEQEGKSLCLKCPRWFDD